MVPAVTLHLKVNGRRKQLDYRKVPFKSWSELKARLQFTPQTLIQAIADGDVEAGMALIWLERRQRERGLSYNRFLREFDEEDESTDVDVLGMQIDGRWIIELDDGEAADSDDEAEEDPTVGSS